MELPVLDIRATTYYLFVILCLTVQPKVFGWAHVPWSWHKRSQGKNKLNRRNAITVAALISNVDVENMDICENSNEKLMLV